MILEHVLLNNDDVLLNALTELKEQNRLDVRIAQPAILFGAATGPDTRFRVSVVAGDFIMLKFTDFIYNLAISRLSWWIF